MLATIRIKALGISQNLHLSIKGFGFLMLLQSQLEKERYNGQEAKADSSSYWQRGLWASSTTDKWKLQWQNTLIPVRGTCLPVITSVFPFSFLKSPSHHGFSSKSVTLVVRSKPPKLNSDPLKHFTRHSTCITFSAAGVLCRTHRKVNCKCQSPFTNAHCVINLKTPNRMCNLPGLSCLGWWRWLRTLLGAKIFKTLIHGYTPWANDSPYTTPWGTSWIKQAHSKIS